MDVLDAGVVHPAGAAGVRVQGALEHGAEDGGADGGPVKVLAGLGEQKAFQLLGKGRDLDVLIGEQAAVDIGEGGQGGVVVKEVFVPVLGLLVQGAEQLHQGLSDAVGGDVPQIVVEHIPAVVENARILGVQAEHQPDAQGVQAFQRLWVGWVLVLLQEGIVQHAHQLAGLERDLFFMLDGIAAGVHQEIQLGAVCGQVGQGQHLRLSVGEVHVVDLKGLEIAHHDPPGLLRLGQIGPIPPGLLIGGQEGAVGLLIAPGQHDVLALLLHQHPGLGDVAVDEFGGALPRAGVVHLHTALEADVLLRLLHPKDLLQQRQPERLGLLLLVPAVLPVRRKLSCRRPLLHVRHGVSPPEFVFSGNIIPYCGRVGKHFAQKRAGEKRFQYNR